MKKNKDVIHKVCAYYEFQSFVEAYAKILNKENNPEGGEDGHKRVNKRI